MKNIFLSFLIIILLAAIFVFSKNYSSAMPDEVKVGKISDYPPGTIQLISRSRVLIIADSQGIYALSAVCTHLGCVINNKGDKLVCPCHKSRFDLSGTVLEGPAIEDLKWYKLGVDENQNLVVDTSIEVSKGTKLNYPSNP